jgi:hypothetical protein
MNHSTAKPLAPALSHKRRGGHGWSRLHGIATMLVAGLIVTQPAQAESWIFGPAYFDGATPEMHPAERRPTRGPFNTRPQGEFVRSGYNYSRNMINIQGRVFDQTTSWESWIQRGAQF